MGLTKSIYQVIANRILCQFVELLRNAMLNIDNSLIISKLEEVVKMFNWFIANVVGSCRATKFGGKIVQNCTEIKLSPRRRIVCLDKH